MLLGQKCLKNSMSQNLVKWNQNYFCSIFFTVNELQKPPWNGFSLAWSKTFDEFAFYLIWYDVGWWWSQNLLPKSKLCDLLYNNPHWIWYDLILEAWKFWGACVRYKFLTPQIKHYPVIVKLQNLLKVHN